VFSRTRKWVEKQKKTFFRRTTKPVEEGEDEVRTSRWCCLQFSHVGPLFAGSSWKICLCTSPTPTSTLSNMPTCLPSSARSMPTYEFLRLISSGWRCQFPINRLPGPVCTRDAVRHWQDGVAAVAHHLLPAGTPRGGQAHLLLTNRARDRKGAKAFRSLPPRLLLNVRFICRRWRNFDE
jgi:hypothetical protein